MKKSICLDSTQSHLFIIFIFQQEFFFKCYIILEFLFPLDSDLAEGRDWPMTLSPQLVRRQFDINVNEVITIFCTVL